MPIDEHWLPWLPAGAYLLGSVLCALAWAAGSQAWSWRVLAMTTRVALAAAVSGGLFVAQGAPADTAAALVTALVGFLGWIIGDYSQRYLRGEPGQPRFTVAFLATLSGVCAVVASPDLPLLILAWACSSAGLHQLLTFYRDRPAAIVVAHKKQLASRAAEACLLVAALLLHREWGSLDLAILATKASAAVALPWTAELAVALVAVAVLIKCAQLPLHGWLIQVMEAPTPVSALLHAGVVNLGGLVLIRLAPLVDASIAARTLLVIVGSVTAVLAGLVMLTRITIKVRLAWSTCSQMGLMVMECGLGLYDLALLHLLAHALYKAHAFLTSGATVRASLEREMVEAGTPPGGFAGVLAPVAALATSALVTAASAAAWHRAAGLPGLSAIGLALVSCGLATLLWRPLGGAGRVLPALLRVIGIVQLYLAWHWLFAGILQIRMQAPAPALAAWALAMFVTLYFAQARVFGPGASSLPGGVYDWIHAGFYLDERFTRLTFRLWPPRLPPTDIAALADPPAARTGTAP